MKIHIKIEGENGAHIEDTYSFTPDTNFPSQRTDMNEEINGMIESMNKHG